MLTESQVIALLRTECSMAGSAAKWAKKHKVSPSAVQAALHGDYLGPKLLGRLGYRKLVMYEETEPGPEYEPEPPAEPEPLPEPVKARDPWAGVRFEDAVSPGRHAAHATNCEYYTDQYPQECTCGLRSRDS